MARHHDVAIEELIDSGQITVLHVDDTPAFADVVAIQLERVSSRLDVVTVPTAADGLDRLDSEAIDCVVSDYDMPETDGLAFLSAVRERAPDLPFILFTGMGSEAIASEAISAGVTDYIRKRSGTDQYELLADRIEAATDRYLIQQELERSFQAIETSEEGIAFLDAEGTFAYVNPAYAAVYGYDRTELVGEHLERIYPDDHVTRVYDEILPSIPETGQWTGESTHIRADGTRLVVSHGFAHTVDGTILSFVRDITEETETRQALEENRRRFEQFIDAVDEYAIFALDPDGFVTSWNQGAERLKGYTESEILGDHFSTFYPTEKRELGYPSDLLETALADGTVEDEGWRVRKDGSRFWADVVITPVFDDEGRHQGFLKVTQDTTDRRATERALKSERDLLDEALDVLDDIFYILDPAGNIVRVTERVTEVTGYTEAELLSMSPLELFAPEDHQRVQTDIDEAFETGAATIEAEVVAKDGTRTPFEFRKRRLTDGDGNVFAVGIGRDVSDRKRQERRFERQLAQFEQFGSVLSHDLRTPLNTALGRLELARETGDDEHFEKARVALERMDELIEDLSGVMREGQLVGEQTPVELAPTVRAVWETLSHPTAELRVDTEGTIVADEEALKRLLENLVTNALEHGGDDVTVTVGDLPDGFYLEDDGPGIPPDERDRVFEAGFSTATDGDGFGLASVHQLVVAHGWMIAATDGRSGGARFEITDVDRVGGLE